MPDFCVFLREAKVITLVVKSELPELLVTLRYLLDAQSLPYLAPESNSWQASILRHFAPAEALDPADRLEDQGREQYNVNRQVSQREAALFRLHQGISSLFAEYLAGSLESLC